MEQIKAMQEAPLVAISFLGTNNYNTATYLWQEQTTTQRFTPQAIRELFPVDEQWVFYTKEAENNKHALQEIGPSHIQFEPTPKGSDEKEIWVIFELLIRFIPKDCRLIVDVTHGYRSQPMLMLSVVQYLQAVGHCHIERVLYFSYEEGRDLNPVFDLTPMTAMGTWAKSVEYALKQMNFEELGKLLTKIHEASWRRGEQLKLKSTKGLGNRLQQLSLNLRTNRMREILPSAARALDALAEVKKETAQYPALAPLAIVLDEIERDLTQIALHLNTKKTELVGIDEIPRYIAMIRHLFNAGYYVTAATMTTELLITHHAASKRVDPIVESNRKRSTDFFYSLVHANSEAADEKAIKWLPAAKLWHKINHLRNDMAHCGWRPQIMPSKTLVDNLESAIASLAEVMNVTFEWPDISGKR